MKGTEGEERKLKGVDPGKRGCIHEEEILLPVAFIEDPLARMEISKQGSCIAT